nr:MAG TPA: hypothetical protein [Caudoviricetes sp.]
MISNYITTKQFAESLEGLGLRLKDDSRYGRNYIDIYENDDIIAYVDTDRRYVMGMTKKAKKSNNELLFKVVCAYANTPVSEREPKTYKLKITGTGLYLIHINEYEATVTTNKKAAKAYDAPGVYNAKELADKQGFALRSEMADADD